MALLATYSSEIKTVKYKEVDAKHSLCRTLKVISLTLSSQMTFLNAEKEKLNKTGLLQVK